MGDAIGYIIAQCLGAVAACAVFTIIGNTGTTFEATYDPASNGERWLRATAVLQPRFVRFNVQFDF